MARSVAARFAGFLVMPGRPSRSLPPSLHHIKKHVTNMGRRKKPSLPMRRLVLKHVRLAYEGWHGHRCPAQGQVELEYAEMNANVQDAKAKSESTCCENCELP